ncbi:MAG: PIG-L family deacetylase [Acidimicrobiia bacterium]
MPRARSQTLVSFHAHPDDEAIATGGTMARAKAEGHRVVLVVATRGELGETPGDGLAAGETLADRRVEETMNAARILGVDRVEFLGYYDSGMRGEPTNDAPECFARADVDEAAQRLARVLLDERADVLTIYDERGTYGHPDHVQVHRVGVRAGELAATPWVFEATMNRDHIRRLIAERPDLAPDSDPTEAVDEADELGVPEALITTAVDVRPFVAQKRAAMAAHQSQIGPESFFLTLPDEAFDAAFGCEWFIRRGARPGTQETTLFDLSP